MSLRQGKLIPPTDESVLLANHMPLGDLKFWKLNNTELGSEIVKRQEISHNSLGQADPKEELVFIHFD